MQRRGSFSFEQSVVHGLDIAQAMHLKAAYLKVRHFGKGAHLRAVALDALLHGLARDDSLWPDAAAGQHERGGHALQIPLEGAANGLVEVVDVEDEPAVGRGKGAQVAHMRVSAKLADDAGVGQYGQIRGHDRNRAAKVAEGRLGHELVFELDERGNSAVHRAVEKRQRATYSAP